MSNMNKYTHKQLLNIYKKSSTEKVSDSLIMTKKHFPFFYHPQAKQKDKNQEQPRATKANNSSTAKFPRQPA